MQDQQLYTFISIILAIGAAGTPIVAIMVRRTSPLDWQFIRFTVGAVAIPVMAILALSATLNEAAAAIIAGVVGYAFGHGTTPKQDPKGTTE